MGLIPRLGNSTRYYYKDAYNAECRRELFCSDASFIANRRKLDLHFNSFYFQNGRLLSQSSRVRIMEICGNHSLVLPRTEPADSGVYTLTATNKLGTNTTTSELRVQGGNNMSEFSGYCL